MAIDKSDYRHVFATVFTHAEELLLSAKQYPNALNQYLESWLEIAEKAAEADNLALQDVILLFIDASSSAFKKTKDLANLTEAQWQSLKNWDNLFASYIDAPDNQHLALALIKCLNDPVLAMGLEPEDELMLFDSFLPVIKQLTTNRKADPVKHDAALTSVVPAAEQNSHPLIPLQIIERSLVNAKADIELPVSATLTVWQQLNPPFTDAVFNLKAMVSAQQQQNKQVFAEYLQSYQQNWQHIAEIIEADGQHAGLLDVVLLFTEISSPAFEQANLTNPHLARLKKWHDLFGNYVSGHGDKQFIVPLIKCLADPIWPAAIAAADEKMLLAGFKEIQKQSSVSGESVVEQPDSVMPEIVEHPDILPLRVNSEEEPEVFPQTQTVKKLTIWQQLEPLFNETALNLKAVVAHQVMNDEAALKLSLQHYLESWLAVAQQIEIGGEQSGLLDVVLLFIEVSRQAFEQLKNFEKKQVTLLNKWQSLFNSYLKAQGNRQLAAALVRCLKDPLWPGAITAEDEKMLLAGFTTIPKPQPEPMPKSIDESICEVFEPAEAVATVIEHPVESETEATLAVSAEVSALAEEIESAVDLVCEDEIIEATLANQDKKDSIWPDVEPGFNQAAAVLKAAVDSEIINDTTAFKHGLQEYVECWQGIADIVATYENLNGLFDVVLLFTELARQTFTRLDSLGSEQFALLNNWQTNFSGYCKTQNNAQFALGLIKCLRDSSWSESIEAEDEPLLLKGLGIEGYYPVISQTETGQDLAANVTIEAKKHPVWQKFAVFFADMQPQIQIMQEVLAVNNNQTCLEYLQQYAEHWLVIAEIIAEEGENLQTLADVTFLFADNCVELVEQNIVLNQDVMQLLSVWHTAFSAYLQDVTAMDTGRCLCECLENSYWLRPLTIEDNGMLLEMMAEESQQQSIGTDGNENPFMLSGDLFSEDDSDEFAWFAEELEHEKEEPEFSVAAEELVTAEPEDVAMFADELLPVDVDETIDFAEALTASAGKADDLLPAKPAMPVNPELISMVRDEFDLLVKELNAEQMQQADATAFKDILRNHEFKFENLAKACNTIGLLGLEQIFEQLSLNMRSRRDSDTFSETESELFKAVLPLIQNYIAAITEPDKSIALVAHLSAQGWKQPLTEAQAKSLLALLSGLVLGSQSQQLDNRKTLAEPLDVSLELPEDVNPELLDSLLNELPVLTNNFSAVIQKIISGNGNIQQLLEAQRIAHTLKGSGNIVGVTGIAVVTHHLEEILEYLTEHKIFPTKALAAVLLESADCLEMMSDLMLNGEKQPPDQALQVLQNVLNWANQIAASGLPVEDADIETTTLPAQPDTDITPVVVQEAKAVESLAMTRVPSEVIDELLRMTGEGSILSEQFKERIKRFSYELKALNELTWQMQSLVSELDQSINIQSYTAKTGRSGADAEFDALELEQYNELHTAASRIAEVATDIREINIHMDEQLVDLKYLMIEEDTIQKENQEMVQSIRMVPANTIASRCQRIVRQACRATNKEVELEIKGADILIDSEILNDMVEPLMHLLRNSIDHGIEPLHIREKYNKPKTGKITLEFSRKGNYAVISCKDDGGGLASGNILQTAIKKGLISAKQQLTDAEIHKLILIPGFSTRAVATQTSGRGIGMDAIQTKISTIQGQMSLSSVRGEGLSIEITIPLTLSSMLSLLVKCGGQTMAISNRGLRKIHHSDECTLVQKEGQLYCDIDYKRYPAKYFAELVGMFCTYSAEQKLPALQIEDEIGRTHIVLVEELLGYRDLLVKNMGCYIPHIQGITGASILGNGDVAPVIDLVEMLHHAAKYDYVLADATKALADSINGLPVALVVDDSLSARRAVAMLLKDLGIEVETAIDGLDAIKHLDKVIPDIILVDLEMPRMNGIELTAHVRGREAIKDTPIIMITSRATEKHRKQAEAAGVTKFMTKPFTEDELINNVRMLMK